MSKQGKQGDLGDSYWLQARERHGSPTLRAIVEASHASATASYRAVRQGLYTAHCSGKNALRRWSKFPSPAVRIQAKAPPPTTLFTMVRSPGDATIEHRVWREPSEGWARRK